MSIREIYEQFNVIPKSFQIDGGKYEHATMQHSDGQWFAYIYKMRGNIRELHSHATSDTEEGAIHNLVLMNTEP